MKTIEILMEEHQIILSKLNGEVAFKNILISSKVRPRLRVVLFNICMI